jgi:hypothetical protein
MVRCSYSIFILALLGLSSCSRAPARRFSEFKAESQRQIPSWNTSTAYPGLCSDGARQLPPPKSKDEEPSFCQLNPGACPPLPAPPESEPNEPDDQAQDPWKSLACIQACDAGGEAMERFCNSLPDKTKRQKEIRAICWGVSRGSRAACVVFCRAYFGPPRTP